MYNPASTFYSYLLSTAGRRLKYRLSQFPLLRFLDVLLHFDTCIIFSANRTKEVVDCIDHLNNFYDCTQDPVFQMFVQADRFLEFIDYFCSQSQSKYLLCQCYCRLMCVCVCVCVCVCLTSLSTTF